MHDLIYYFPYKYVDRSRIYYCLLYTSTAENGERTIYIRITKPDNDVLTKSASNTFPYENRTLVYSIKKYIEYLSLIHI